MNAEQLRPLWVIEQSLNAHLFDCCGDEDLFPLQCHACAHVAVFCSECDALYPHLRDLSHWDRVFGQRLQCPSCSATFDDDFMRAPCHRIDFDDWHKAGLDHLLVDRPMSEFLTLLASHASLIAGYLDKGMRSTARTQMTDFRNLAEAICAHVENAEELRRQGSAMARSSSLAATMKWYQHIRNVPGHPYALVGITDVVVP